MWESTIPTYLFTCTGLIVSLVVCGSLRGNRFSRMVNFHHRVQDIHQSRISRFGGVGIFLGVQLPIYFLTQIGDYSYPNYLIFSSIVFTVGFLDDWLGHVSTYLRFAVILGASVLVTSINNLTLTSVEGFYIEKILAYHPLAFLVTAIAISGLTNAANIIDGLNGLSVGNWLISFIAIWFLIPSGHDDILNMVCVIFAAASLGFLIINFPKGNIFCGDSGAYFLGFSAACIALSVHDKFPNVSAWSIALIFIYPIWETVFTICRRALSGKPIFEADSGHLHRILLSIVSVKMKTDHSGRLWISNAIASSLILTVIASSAFLAVVMSNNPTYGKILVVSYLSLYSFLSFYGEYKRK